MNKTDEPKNNETNKTESSELQSSSDTVESLAEARARKKGRAYMAPIPGFTWNPLVKLPRNMPCPCRSQKKFKACCLPNLPLVVRDEDAKFYREQMESPNLTFVTKENEAELRVAAEMRAYFAEQDRKKTDGESLPEITDEAKATFQDALAKAQERYKKDNQNG